MKLRPKRGEFEHNNGQTSVVYKGYGNLANDLHITLEYSGGGNDLTNKKLVFNSNTAQDDEAFNNGTNSISLSGTDKLCIGSDTEDGNPLFGKVAEILIYDGNPRASDVNIVEDYQ